MTEAKKDDKKDEKGAPAAAAAPGRKKLLVGVGGGVAVLALAFFAALAGLPQKAEQAPQLGGPFVGALTPKIQVNLNDAHSFLVLELNLLYDAYQSEYLSERTADAVCNAEIRDALVALASAKSRVDVSDKVNKPVFLEEIRRAIEPLLFPVHVGGAHSPADADEPSGLAPGRSMPQATFRGLYEEHVVHVDAITKTLKLDDAAPMAFTGAEDDFALKAADETLLYLDLTRLEPEFRGEVKVGVKGRTRRVLWNEILIQ
jgi:flagellar basal body-associated protein FliL